ncbi:hypothetical protein KC19_2G140800 [Ceratodon purpureus]|uniref:Uncharacterized protein n=1 Tax=Ceratodon purpureus TaxID=3225 RepID=A0A8T0IVE7_CERPU|nr:hypothetical protein KC19_2G140800 [Ceratodon purpureus]
MNHKHENLPKCPCLICTFFVTHKPIDSTFPALLFPHKESSPHPYILGLTNAPRAPKQPNIHITTEKNVTQFYCTKLSTIHKLAQFHTSPTFTATSSLCTHSKPKLSSQSTASLYPTNHLELTKRKTNSQTRPGEAQLGTWVCRKQMVRHVHQPLT